MAKQLFFLFALLVLSLLCAVILKTAHECQMNLMP